MSSIDKALSILELLSKPNFEYSLDQISKHIDISKSGACKILAQLISHNLVCKKSNLYSLGGGVVNLQIAYEKQELNWIICKPILEELCIVTGETCTIAKWGNDSALIVYRIKSRENLRVEGNLGKSLPINASAHGKLFGAYLDSQIVNRLIETKPLVKLCPNTITDETILRQEFKKIRKAGLAISIEESSIGAVGIAAPIFNANGDMIASLCVGTPTARMTKEKEETIKANVIKFASILSLEIKENKNK